MSSLSLRAIAKTLGLSHTTVSEALRDSPKVRAETKERVFAAAQEMGYQRNPLAGALMSEIRKSRSGTFRGTLAIIDWDGNEGRPEGALRYHRELARVATRRARELGFQTDFFSVGPRGMSQERLNRILQSRGVQGVFILPVSRSPNFNHFDWERFSGIYADFVIEQPGLHTVCPDHYRAMFTALNKLYTLGYRRPGLVLEAHHDQRLLHHWEAAYHVFLRHHGKMHYSPPLVQEDLGREEFVSWFREGKFDVVLAHKLLIKEWMTTVRGVRVPATCGFCCLNIINSTKPCAGLDLQPQLLGERGIELLIGQVLRNESGISEQPVTTTVPAVWVDGPTVRNQAQKPAAGGKG